ncbi:MAG TPA: FMN-binding protein [Anaerolineaceae bacterium]|nr:FMN-binding protein [Anaerolineaceae bacterium]
MNAKENVKVKGKSKGRGCLIALLVILVILAVAGGIGWSFLSKEHQEAASLPLNAVDFAILNDGVYHGAYAGGMYGWRKNECNVTVTNGKVTDIKLAGSTDPGAKNTGYETLYERVIASQSLQVDTISGATLTSKAYLQCVENALIPAQHE